MAKHTCKRRKYEGAASLGYRLVIAPLFFMILPLLLHAWNICVKNATTIYWITIGLYILIILLTVYITVLYVNVGYCSSTQRCTHQYNFTILTFCFGATLGSYDFYTYNLDVYVGVWVFVMWVGALCSIFINFCKGHIHRCPSEDETELPSYEELKGGSACCRVLRSNEMLSALLIVLFLAWCAFILLIVAYDNSLYTNRSEVACLTPD